MSVSFYATSRAAFAARVFMRPRNFFVLLLLLPTACTKPSVAPLPKLTIDNERIAVAGMSSGAYMATQVHLAYSDHLIGAALLAGGPYGCAQGSLDIALTSCIAAEPSAPDAVMLARLASERSKNRQLSPLSGLSNDHVFIMHGRNDKIVAEKVSAATTDFYTALSKTSDVSGLKIQNDTKRNFGHTFPTETEGGACIESEAHYLGRCNFDAAGLIMQNLFGIAKTKSVKQASGELHQFNQSAYLPKDEDAFLADSGYVYIPKDCIGGTACGLLIAFHGCEQNAEKVKEVFVRDTGFNRWADTMNVVVLYPQTRVSYLPLNPKACWDWWGYSGAGYDTRSGVQMRWLVNTVAALGARLE